MLHRIYYVIMSLKHKYGNTALIAGGSEGIGGAFANHLAAEGIHLILIARNREKLEAYSEALRQKYEISVTSYAYDLAQKSSLQDIGEQLRHLKIDIFIYNAALSHIGAFEAKSPEFYSDLITTNISAPLQFVYQIAEQMKERKKGAIILMSSLAGFQGSGNVAVYAATKAFNLNLAEGLWYELRHYGIDVLACCPGATSSPNYVRTKPKKMGFLSPKVLTPAEVVREAFSSLGRTPSRITGFGNRLVAILMHRILPRKASVKMMGDATRDLYDL